MTISRTSASSVNHLQPEHPSGQTATSEFHRTECYCSPSALPDEDLVKLTSGESRPEDYGMVKLPTCEPEQPYGDEPGEYSPIA